MNTSVTFDVFEVFKNVFKNCFKFTSSPLIINIKLHKLSFTNELKLIDWLKEYLGDNLIFPALG